MSTLMQYNLILIISGKLLFLKKKMAHSQVLGGHRLGGVVFSTHYSWEIHSVKFIFIVTHGTYEDQQLKIQKLSFNAK